MAALLAAGPLAAQGLPTYVSMNPILRARSGLYFQPYVDPAPRWQFRILTDYASAVELSERPNARIVLDSELLRVDATMLRNLGRGFIGATASFVGAYDGFLDGFLDWYHNLTGLHVKAREVLPKNQFDYSIQLPDGRTLARQPTSGALGDLRIFGGLRHSEHWQTAVAITLPVASTPEGYDRGVVSASGITTLRLPIGKRWAYEGSFGLGYTPRHGDLSDFQLTFFQSLSSGLRWRFSGRQAMFVNLFYQSSNYENTTLPSMDQREVTLDYGFLLKARKGPEWFLGMTEDLEPKGPAIDLSFRIGARW
jgi:hypothetical protein